MICLRYLVTDFEVSLTALLVPKDPDLGSRQSSQSSPSGEEILLGAPAFGLMIPGHLRNSSGTRLEDISEFLQVLA